MCALASIGVDNNLSAGQTGVAMRTANHKLACRIDKILNIVAKQSQYLRAVNLGFDAWDENVDDVGLDPGEHLLVVGIKLVVLCADHDGVDTLWDTIVAVLNGYLALRVGTQVSHLLAFFANLGQCAHQQVCQVERDGHITLCLVGGITEHHALVAGSLVLVVLTVYTAVDVDALLMNSCQDTA